MGRQTGDQSQLFYLFNLEGRISASHLLRRINPIVTQALAGLREKLAPFYSEIGRPSVGPELMLRMLIVGYCYGYRFERRLCEEVELHLACGWFCRLDLDDKVPDHSTFSVNRYLQDRRPITPSLSQTGHDASSPSFEVRKVDGVAAQPV
jgi:transposase